MNETFLHLDRCYPTIPGPIPGPPTPRNSANSSLQSSQLRGNFSVEPNASTFDGRRKVPFWCTVVDSTSF